MKLTLNQVTKRYKYKTALDSITAELNEGIYGVLGANGSGKTTLMQILATVLKPTNGTITLDGREILGMDEEYRELLGYLPQQAGVYRSFSAEKFLLYIAALKGLPRDKAKQKVPELLKLVGLISHRKEKLGKFSGGMRQRVGIAQALLNDPKILIVDEPTAGLDPNERVRFRNILSTIAAERIILLSTHIVSDIEFIAKEIMVLKAGQLIKKAKPEELLDEVHGKVWTVNVRGQEIPAIQSRYKVGNIFSYKEDYTLRIISDTQPHEYAVNKRPNLEDLYLYYFDEERNE
ncbi:ABC transporter ATP-binding protein [Halobacillus sp. B29]|uniref:ABC transporter ATP-binding protein n=1 Tax=Halobacillus sp. B29 TaxID=3457432 RepID=UPI003FCD56F7